MRRLFSGTIAAVALSTFASAGSAGELLFSGVATTSDDYQLAVIWSNILAEAGGETSITPVENGSVAGMRAAAQGEVDIVGIGAPHYRDALGNTGRFTDDPPEFVEAYEGMQALFAIPTGMAQYVTRADSEIHTLSDFRDHSVGIGRPGGNAGRVSGILFGVHGMDMEAGEVDGQHLEYVPALEQLAAGTLDATLVWGGLPHPAVDNASRGTPLRFVSPDPATLGDFREAITNGEFYIFQEVPADTIEAAYEGRVEAEGPAYFWTFPFQIMVSADMPEDTAYEIVKALWENIETVHGQSAALSLISLDTALESLSADLHPGAERYYREVGAL